MVLVFAFNQYHLINYAVFSLQTKGEDSVVNGTAMAGRDTLSARDFLYESPASLLSIILSIILSIYFL